MEQWSPEVAITSSRAWRRERASAPGARGFEKASSVKRSERGAVSLAAENEAPSIVAMELPINPPLLPMLATRVDELPSGDGWIFEPKWDGFRTLVFRDGDEMFIQSRDERPLDRYFPELVETLKTRIPERCVLDGEIVIASDHGLE